MKLRTTWIALGLLLATPALAAPPFAGGGTDILHLTLRVDFAPDTDPDATGTLSAKLRQQGRADVQKLLLEVAGLEPDAPHHLHLWLRDAVDPVAVLSFDTDENGEASLKLMHLGHVNTPGKRFPDGLDPLSNVLAMEVRDDLDAVLLGADLTDPDRLRYLVKRRLTNAGVDDDAAGSLFMKQHGEKALFRLRAGGLDADTGYTLALLAGMTETLVAVTTDADGRLDVKGLPDGAPAPFAMTAVEIRDGLDQRVLGTELP